MCTTFENACAVEKREKNDLKTPIFVKSSFRTCDWALTRCVTCNEIIKEIKIITMDDG